MPPQDTESSTHALKGQACMDAPPSVPHPSPSSLVLRRISPQDTVPLRHAVLWPNKPVEYVLLPEDDTGYHFGAFLDGDSDSISGAQPVAVISLFRESVPTEHAERAEAAASFLPGQNTSTNTDADVNVKTARFRKFACAPVYQGRGIGTALLRHAMEAARTELGCRNIWCDARMESAPWYERRGLRRFGDIFYKGEVEYVKMCAEL
ncbi:hypothetical protein EIP86_000918 [Pleurotus ostreatoroseus]|nr:hypothetical protein EIP86_000918 [Pleurotus ostreatoroseus]